MNLPLVVMHKRRQSFSHTETTHVVGDIRGRRPIIIDDIIAGGSVLKQIDACCTSMALKAARTYLSRTRSCSQLQSRSWSAMSASRSWWSPIRYPSRPKSAIRR